MRTYLPAAVSVAPCLVFQVSAACAGSDRLRAWLPFLFAEEHLETTSFTGAAWALILASGALLALLGRAAWLGHRRARDLWQAEKLLRQSQERVTELEWENKELRLQIDRVTQSVEVQRHQAESAQSAVRAAEVSRRAMSPFMSRTPERRLRILLAEDNATSQMLAATLLEKEGHAVTVAGDGIDALAAMERQSFDVVLMDMQMPRINGFEATAQMRAREQQTGSRIPILALTADALGEHRESCLAAGMDGYLTKPIKVRELYRALADLLPSSHAAAEAAAPLPADGSLSSLPGISTMEDPAVDELSVDLDRNALLKRVGGREEHLRRLIGLFLEESSGLMAEMGRALANGDARALIKPAHSLKGAAGLFGVPELTAAARKLESLGESIQLEPAAEVYRTLEKQMNRLRQALTTLVAPSSDPSSTSPPC